MKKTLFMIGSFVVLAAGLMTSSPAKAASNCENSVDPAFFSKDIGQCDQIRPDGDENDSSCPNNRHQEYRNPMSNERYEDYLKQYGFGKNTCGN
jgi:hypothetical protein